MIERRIFTPIFSDLSVAQRQLRFSGTWMPIVYLLSRAPGRRFLARNGLFHRILQLRLHPMHERILLFGLPAFMLKQFGPVQ